MCGIAGALTLGTKVRREELAHVQGMTRVLHHRGPDGLGYYHDEHCVLGNTRLNIIDLSRKADLPMSNADGTVWITYNGEVTNYQELRREYRLDQKYPRLNDSDTEVLIHLYEELGIGFCRFLTGQFAFGLYDSRIGKAWVVRDFYGIRPTFYMATRDRLYFASEIKSFLELPDFEPELDYEGFYHFFSLAYLPEEHTPFKMVRELQGGRLIEVDLKAGSWEERSYYEVRYDPDPTITEKDITEPLYQQMRDSVRRNLIADVPVGLTFSGGFDTSSILALCREVTGHDNTHTFSIVMGESSFDESRYQHMMRKPGDPTHHEIKVGPKDTMDHLVEHMAFMDEPTGDGAAIPSYILAREAKKYVSVLLSGEGGDETFNAYETHMACLMRNWYRKALPRPLRWLAYHTAHALPVNHRKLSFDFLAKRFTEGARLPVPEAHLYWRYVLLEQDKEKLMPDYDGLKPTSKLFSDLYHSLDFKDDLNRISLMDLKHYFIGDLMVKNDRTMMAHSVEARFPYMDRLLLEFVSKIPTKLRIKRLTRRYIQKQAMKGRVPNAIYKRQNMGLEMPHSIWFLEEFRPLVERYFNREKVEQSGFLSYKAVSGLWNEHLQRKRDNGRALWCILNVLVWLDLFVHERSYRSYLPVPSTTERICTPGAP